MYTDNSGEGRLWAVFMEARHASGQRTQWMLFAPACKELGSSHDPDGAGRFIKRRIERPGHRAKWNTTERTTQERITQKLTAELEQYESTGWVLVQPILIALEHDDWMKAWEPLGGKTPYKALRHVNKVAERRGYTV